MPDQYSMYVCIMSMCKCTCKIGAERTPDPGTSGNRCDPIECQDPDIEENCLFHINCAVFFVSSVFIMPEL